MRNYILLFVNGRQHQVTGADALLTLSDFLRRRLKLCGTKIVCSEGDCGSCSVLCGRINSAEDAEFCYDAIDSCIGFVFQFDGCHIVSVEGLNGNEIQGQPQLNTVQQAMIDCHGSQCGFCTPGFVVAMTGVLERFDSSTDNSPENGSGKPTAEDWRHELTGNLCRCTGYSPIIEAGLQCSSDNTPPVSSIYPADAMLSVIRASAADAIRIETEHDAVLYCPTTIDQALEFLKTNPQTKIVAGATDVGVRFNKGDRDYPCWMSLSRIGEMEGVTINGDAIEAGARATWTEFENLIEQRVPQFHHIVSIFGSPQIRNMGTIGGNIINASPIADSIPFLFVCEAELELTSASGSRTVNINDFYHGYKKFDLQAGELLTRIRIPLPAPSANLRLYKVSRRRDLDISTFTAAISLECNANTITSAAIAYGAVGPVVLRLRRTESFLRGKPMSLETMRQAGEVAIEEITPITDVRGREDYRYQLARNVLLKYFHETQAQGVPA